MQRSYLGYDPIIGARYYGIGNEYMGVVIGSSILCAAAVFQWKKTGVRLWEKMLTALLFFLLLMYFSSPRLGTNAGGAITAVFAYTVAYARMFRLRLTKKSIAWMLAVMASGLTMLLLANAWTENPTHIGEAFQALLAGNTSWILDIIQRKLEMNWRLFQVSSWNKVFITSLVILAAMFLRPKGALKALFERYPYLMNGVTGIVAGAFVTLFINDSGIVAAATAIIYGVVPLLYIIIQEKARHPHSRLSPVSLGKE